MSIDWALVILGRNSNERTLIFLLIRSFILSLLLYGFKIPINVWFSLIREILSSVGKPNWTITLALFKISF